MIRSRWQQQVAISDSGKSRFSRNCTVHLCRQKLISHHQKAEPFSSSSSLAPVWHRRPMWPRGLPFLPRLCISFVHISLDTLQCKLLSPLCLHKTQTHPQWDTNRPPQCPSDVRHYQQLGFGRHSSGRILACTMHSPPRTCTRYERYDAHCRSAYYQRNKTTVTSVTSLPQHLPAEISMNFTLIVDMQLRSGEQSILPILQSNQLIQRRI